MSKQGQLVTLSGPTRSRRPGGRARCAARLPRSPRTPSPPSSPRSPPTPAPSPARWARRSRARSGSRSAPSSTLPRAVGGGRPGTPLSPALEARVRARPRRGARRPQHGRAARRVPGRRPRGLARAGRDHRRQPGCPAATVAAFAELVFAYIDELSAASVAGHADELADVRPGPAARTWTGSPSACSPASRRTCSAAAPNGADWIAAADPDRGAAARAAGRAPCSPLLDPRRPCRAPRSCPGTRGPRGALLLVPDARRVAAGALLRRAAGHRAVVGPARPWVAVGRLVPSGPCALSSAAAPPAAPCWTPRSTWPGWCCTPTRRRWPTCAPRRSRRWPGCAPATAAKLAETLRSWLLHQGRRDESPPSSSCIRRPSATGWLGCASCTATGCATRHGARPDRGAGVPARRGRG